jgi:uncharacterized protein
MAKFRFLEWLVDWFHEQESFSFDWDDGNNTKSNVKHAITCDEAESVFQQPEAIRALGEQIEPRAPEPRYGIFGMTISAKPVFICFTLRGSGVRIISARPLNKRERVRYAKICEE